MQKSNRRNIYRFGKKAHKKSLKGPVLFLFLILVSFLLYGIFRKGSVWNGKDKFTIAIRGENEDVKIVVFDPAIEKITIVKIPGETEVQVSRKLGTWRLKSLWELGENEGIGGALLAETATRYLKFPTTAWADSKAYPLATGNLVQMVKSEFFHYETNIGFPDRISLFLFGLKVGNTQREEIDLAETGYLRKTTFVDGESGYEVLRVFPNELLAVFSDPFISKNQTKVMIKDSSGDGSVSESLSGVVEVMGGKIASIAKEEETDEDCTVFGKEHTLVAKFSVLFGCTVVRNTNDSVFEVEIRIGKAFARRY